MIVGCISFRNVHMP